LSITIAVDILGGDHAPLVPLEGVASTHDTFQDVSFLLFGPQEIIQDFLDKKPHLKDRCHVVDAPEHVTNDTPARDAVRGLKNSSMRLAIEAVRDGKAQGVVSGGNTGAYMALSKIILKTLEGIDRPAITGTLPSLKGAIVMLDLGANVEATAEQLCQFAQMGEAFSRHVLGHQNPSVGLLNIGSEELKGHADLKEAYDIIKATKAVANFHGYVEGDDIMHGTTDVVVTDGFTGNVSLKTMEGAVHFLVGVFKEELSRKLRFKVGALLAKDALTAFKQQLDPRHHNGAPFLGLKGVAVKSHGGMDEVGFSNALGVAINMVSRDLNSHILEEVRRIQGFE